MKVRYNWLSMHHNLGKSKYVLIRPGGQFVFMVGLLTTQEWCVDSLDTLKVKCILNFYIKLQILFAQSILNMHNYVSIITYIIIMLIEGSSKMSAWSFSRIN